MGLTLIIDTEVTGTQRDKGAPFNLDNKLCLVGIKELGNPEKKIFKIEYDEEPYGEQLEQIRTLVKAASEIVWFNAKFDLHWLRRYDVVPSDSCRHYDCQSAFFILTQQRFKYPSLNQVCEYFNLPLKLDVVKTEFWDKGIDTDEIPLDILTEYLEGDLERTEWAYNALKELTLSYPTDTHKIISLCHQDVRVLADMEWNGMRYNVDKSLRYGENLARQIEKTDQWLRRIFGADWINIDSGDHLSAVLYGGTILLDGTEEYLFTYKDGKTKTKTRKCKIPHNFPRIFVPIEGTALAKEGFYSTDKATLKTLQSTCKGEKRQILDALLNRSKLEKQRGTYYQGFPKLIEKMNWKDHVIHGNLNQCVVITGRLSSDKPNLQNIEAGVKECFVQ